MRDFFDGTETPNTLWNLLQAFRMRRTSFYSAAQATDMEEYERSLKTRGRAPGAAVIAPHLTEVDLNTSLLMSIHELLQANNYLTTGRPGKPKVKPLPRPETAASIYARHKAREEYKKIDAALKFVSIEEFNRTLETREG